MLAAASRRLAPPGKALLDNIPLILICLLPVLLYLPALATPFERDEGVYATVAQGLLEGKIPYRDLFDNKPPLVYGWYALSFLLFGETVVAPRILASFLLSGTTLCLYGQVRMLFPKRVALLAAALFALSTGVPFLALHANTEAYMVLPLVASLVVFTIGMRRERMGWFVAAGLFSGAAIMTKQVAFWNLFALAAVAVIWRLRTDGWRPGAFKPAGLLFAGAALGVALVSIPFVATGAVGDLYYANVSYNWLYVGVLSAGERLANFLYGSSYVFFAVAPLIVGSAWGVFTILRRRRRPLDYLVVAWALASLAGVATGGRFFPHYFLHLMPALAVLTAVVAHEFIKGRRIRRWRPTALALAGGLTVLALGTNAVMYLAPREAQEEIAPTVAEQKEWERDSRLVGLYIKARTTPEDRIFNFGREAQIYFHADRDPAVRYFADWPFWWKEETLYETVKALRHERPAYIIDTALPPLFEDYAKYHPPVLMNLLREEYVYEGRVLFADIYRLKTHEPPLPTAEFVPAISPN
jgi:4-amino-4-deoxy-L-arabinose transferase-like glycosyltransferase